MFDDEEFVLIENCNEDDLYAFLGIGKDVRINEIIDFYNDLCFGLCRQLKMKSHKRIDG